MGGATVASRTGYETPGPTIKWAFYLKVRMVKIQKKGGEGNRED